MEINLNQQIETIPKKVMTVEEFLENKGFSKEEKIIIRVNGITILSKNREFSFVKDGDDIELRRV